MDETSRKLIEEFREISKRIRLVGGEPGLLELTPSQEDWLIQAFQRVREDRDKEIIEKLKELVDIESQRPHYNYETNHEEMIVSTHNKVYFKYRKAIDDLIKSLSNKKKK